MNLICVEDGIDSSKEAGKLLISIIAVVAEMEREISEYRQWLGVSRKPEKPGRKDKMETQRWFPSYFLNSKR